jgi:hypothetical protein
MSVSSIEVLFMQVADDCIAGKITKEQAFQRLEIRYQSVYKDIKKELGEDHIGFCFCVPCDFKKWVNICDGVERNKPHDSKWKNSHKIIQNVIDKVTANYRDILGLEDWESKADDEVWQEVHQIQNICRENREVKELYKKYEAKIKALPEVIHQQTIEHLDIPEKVQAAIEKTLAILVKEGLIKVIKLKTGQNEYRITTTVPKIKRILEVKKNEGEIMLPDIKGIDEFLIKHIKNKNGDTLKDAIRTNKNREKKKHEKCKTQ